MDEVGGPCWRWRRSSFRVCWAGSRVTQNSTFLAAVHACVGQAFFALMVALCVFTGRRWQSAGVERANSNRRPAQAAGLGDPGSGAGADRAGKLAPALWNVAGTRSHHAFLAAVVWGCCLFLAFVVEQQQAELGGLVPSARALGLLATLQVGLGIGAFIVVAAF